MAGIFGAIWDTLNGNLVSKEVQRQRMYLCNNCPNKRGTNCMKCGCILAWKTYIPDEECPVGKWSKSEAEKKD